MKVRESGMPDRDYWESLIDHCGLLTEMALLDAGSVFEVGVGYGSFLDCFGARVRLAGIDIESDMVAATRRRLSDHHQDIAIQQGDFLHDDLTDLAGRFEVCLLMNILHHQHPSELIQLAKRLLLPGGRLGVCHWRDDIETPRGPPKAMRVGLAQARELVSAAGLVVLQAEHSLASPYHYLLTARLPQG